MNESGIECHLHPKVNIIVAHKMKPNNTQTNKIYSYHILYLADQSS